MRRYEFVEGSSSKFWEIELEGESFTTRWGRIGTDGQEKTQDFDSEAEARKAHDKVIAEKEKKGYRLVSADEPDARPLTAKFPVNVELEARLVAAPGDMATWHVLADWLIEQGESWGSVINAAVSGKPDLSKQGAAQEALAADNAEFTWVNGVIDTFSFTPEDFELDPPMEVSLSKVLKHPAGHFVRSLTLGLPPSEDTEWNMDALIETLVSCGPLPFLRVLDMSPDADHMDQPSWRRVGDLSKLWPVVPQLRELYLQGAQGSDSGTPIKFGRIDAPNLEKVVFKSGGLDEDAPVSLGKAKLPKLKHLELWFGSDDYGCNCTMASLEGILDGKNLPALETLGFKNSEFGPELVDVVATSRLLPRLKVVDFSMGTFANEAADALIRHAARFQHLQAVVLDDNFFSDGDKERLTAALPNARIGVQKETDDPEWRYATVAE